MSCGFPGGLGLNSPLPCSLLLPFFFFFHNILLTFGEWVISSEWSQKLKRISAISSLETQAVFGNIVKRWFQHLSSPACLIIHIPTSLDLERSPVLEAHSEVSEESVSNSKMLNRDISYLWTRYTESVGFCARPVLSIFKCDCTQSYSEHFS